MMKILRMFPLMALVAVVSSWVTKQLMDDDEQEPQPAGARRRGRSSRRPQREQRSASVATDLADLEPTASERRDPFAAEPELPAVAEQPTPFVAEPEAPEEKAPEPEIPAVQEEPQPSAMIGDWVPVEEVSPTVTVRPIDVPPALAPEAVDTAESVEEEDDEWAPVQLQSATVVEDPKPVSEIEVPEPFAEVDDLESVAEIEVPEPFTEVDDLESVAEIEIPEPFTEVDDLESMAEIETPEPFAEVETPDFESDWDALDATQPATAQEPEALQSHPDEYAWADPDPTFEEPTVAAASDSAELLEDDPWDGPTKQADEPVVADWPSPPTNAEPEPPEEALSKVFGARAPVLGLTTREESSTEPESSDDFWSPAEQDEAGSPPPAGQHLSLGETSTQESAGIWAAVGSKAESTDAFEDLPADAADVPLITEESEDSTSAASTELDDLTGQEADAPESPMGDLLEDPINAIRGEDLGSRGDELAESAAEETPQEIVSEDQDDFAAEQTAVEQPAADQPAAEAADPGPDLRLRRTWKPSSFSEEWDPESREGPGSELGLPMPSGSAPTDPTTFFDRPSDRVSEPAPATSLESDDHPEPIAAPPTAETDSVEAEPAPHQDDSTVELQNTLSIDEVEPPIGLTPRPQPEVDPFALDDTWEPEPGLPEDESALDQPISTRSESLPQPPLTPARPFGRVVPSAEPETEIPVSFSDPHLAKEGISDLDAEPDFDGWDSDSQSIEQGIAGLWAQFTEEDSAPDEELERPLAVVTDDISDMPADVEPVVDLITDVEEKTSTEEEGWLPPESDASLAITDDLSDPVTELSPVVSPEDERPEPEPTSDTYADAGAEPDLVADEGAARAFIDEGNAFYEIEAFELAEHRYSRAIAAAAGMVDAYYNRANARVRLGDLEGALSDFNRAIELSPDDPDALNNRGMLYLSAADAERALKDFEQAAERRPDDPTILVNLGVALTEIRRFTEALRTFERAAVLDPSDAAARYGAARAAARLSELDRALVHVREALELDPSFREEMAKDPMLESLQSVDAFGELLRI